MTTSLLWGSADTESNIFKIKDNRIDLLLKELKVPEDSVVDAGSDEVITIMWDEENTEGPTLLILEENELTVSSGEMSEYEELAFQNRYIKFLENLI